MLVKLATFLHAHSRRVLLIAVLGAAVAGALGAGVANRLSPYGADDPSTQSVRATHRFQDAAGRQFDPGVVALVTPTAPLRSAAGRAEVQRVAIDLRSQPDIVRVQTVFETHDAGSLSRDGRSTIVLGYFRAKSDKRLSDDARVIEKRFAGRPGVKLGGLAIAQAQVNSQVSHDLTHAELLAFPFIFILSLLFFRSLVAALLPPLLGGMAIVATFFALRVISSFADLSVFALNLTTGLGLGLAIDYSLLMVSRYREEAAAGGFDAAALQRTLATAGRTILFSSVTVAVAAGSLMIFPQRFLYSMGIAGGLVALIAAALALLVLPALLAALGHRVNALSPKRLARAADREARPAASGAWYRLAHFVIRRPAPIAAVSAAALIAVGIPFAGVKFKTVDASVLPATASARQVEDTLNSQFPPNRTAPLQVIVGVGAGSRAERALSTRIARMPDVSAVAHAQPGGPGLSLLQVAPVQAPLSDATQTLLHRIRQLTVPYYLGVAGQTAAYVDLEHSLGVHLPVVLAIVIVATLVVLFLMTGSVILPIKQVLMNGLTLSAVFGFLVLVFQDGNLQGLLGYTSNGALEATQPILLFVMGFGLATDYGVFLLARIKEAREAGVPDSEAIAVGIERSGRIVTACAVLFAVAIGAFATSQIVFIKELGLGTALSVLIDASVIRTLLVPSLMQLLGAANWWAPRPLRRVHERLGLRESPAPAG
jgi:RND superfamily putative drug exporter